MKTWRIQSRAIDEVVQAEDQFEAWNTLRDRSTPDFGLIVSAEPDENADPFYVYTSALMTLWGREEDAVVFREIALAAGLHDTTQSDNRFAEAHH